MLGSFGSKVPMLRVADFNWLPLKTNPEKVPSFSGRITPSYPRASNSSKVYLSYSAQPAGFLTEAYKSITTPLPAAPTSPASIADLSEVNHTIFCGAFLKLNFVNFLAVPWYTTCGTPSASTTLLSPNHALNSGVSTCGCACSSTSPCAICSGPTANDGN